MLLIVMEKLSGFVRVDLVPMRRTSVLLLLSLRKLAVEPPNQYSTSDVESLPPTPICLRGWTAWGDAWGDPWGELSAGLHPCPDRCND